MAKPFYATRKKICQLTHITKIGVFIMSAKTVLRAGKIKLGGACAHNFREYKRENEATNVDKNRTEYNQILIGGSSTKEVLEAQEKRLIGVKGTKQKPPKNFKSGEPQELVKNIELDFSASAEYFFKNHDQKLYESLVMKNPNDHEKINTYWNNHLDQDKLEAWKKEVMKFVAKEFGDKCISAILHLDEKCPHIHIEVVPIITDKFGKELLSAKRFYTPETTLGWQDRYAQQVARLGIERGQEHSQAVHLHQDEYHDAKAVEQLANAIQPPKVEVPRPYTEQEIFEKKKNIFGAEKKVQVVSTEDILKNQTSREKAQGLKYKFYKGFYNENHKLLAAAALAIKENKKYREALKTEKLLKEQYRKEINKMRTPEFLEQMRQIPLGEVCQRLGYEVKQEGKNYQRVKTDEINLVINTQKNSFSENNSMVNKFGAIDLLESVFNYKFNDAVNFLSEHFSATAVAKTILAQPIKAVKHIAGKIEESKTTPPAPVPKNLPNIVRYLTDTRKIDKALVDDLLNNGRLYADKFNNCCFPNEDNSFAALRGTHPTKTYKLNLGAADFYIISNQEDKTKQPDKIFLFESPIELLSFRTLHPEEKGTFVSFNGNSMIGRTEKLKLDQYKEIVCCFNSDDQGKKFTQKIKEELMFDKDKVKVITPQAKDFNDDLVNRTNATQNKSMQQYKTKKIELGL